MLWLRRSSKAACHGWFRETHAQRSGYRPKGGVIFKSVYLFFIMFIILPIVEIAPANAYLLPELTVNEIPPIVSSSTTFQLVLPEEWISSLKIVHYKYKLDYSGPFGLEEGTYGQETSANEPIVIGNLSPGGYFLRLIFKDADGIWTNEDRPIGTQWQVVPGPVVYLGGVSNNLNNANTGTGKLREVEVPVLGEGITHYKYNVVPGIGTPSGSYGPEIGVETPIVLENLGLGEYTLRVIGKDGSGTWQPEPFATTARWSVRPVGRGDIDGDGLIQLSDAILAFQVVAKKSAGIVYEYSDVNGDGRIGLAEGIFAMNRLPDVIRSVHGKIVPEIAGLEYTIRNQSGLTYPSSGQSGFRAIEGEPVDFKLGGIVIGRLFTSPFDPENSSFPGVFDLTDFVEGDADEMDPTVTKLAVIFF